MGVIFCGEKIINKSNNTKTLTQVNQHHKLESSRDKLERNPAYQLIACPTFIVMSVFLQRIFGHLSPSLSLVILQKIKQTWKVKKVKNSTQQSKIKQKIKIPPTSPCCLAVS